MSAVLSGTNFVSPITCNVDAGASIPIPTLPSSLKRIISFSVVPSLVRNAKSASAPLAPTFDVKVALAVPLGILNINLPLSVWSMVSVGLTLCSNKILPPFTWNNCDGESNPIPILLFESTTKVFVPAPASTINGVREFVLSKIKSG